MSSTTSPSMAGMDQRAGPWRRLLVFGLNPLAMVQELWLRRDLLQQFTRRELQGKYQGSYLGFAWSFVTPLVTLGVFAFVFGLVFKSQWPNPRGLATAGGLGDFTLNMFAGMIAFQMFADPVGRSPGLITAVPNFVKKVVFPLHILPVSLVGAALVHGCIALLILLGGQLWVHGSVPWTFICAPLLLLPVAALALGISWFLAALGVYVRDIAFVTGVVTQCLMFASPIFYPISQVPEDYRWIVYANPLTPCVENLRAVTVTGVLPDPSMLVISLCVGVGAMILGHAWFVGTRKGFADVL